MRKEKGLMTVPPENRRVSNSQTRSERLIQSLVPQDAFRNVLLENMDRTSNATLNTIFDSEHNTVIYTLQFVQK